MNLGAEAVLTASQGVGVEQWVGWEQAAVGGTGKIYARSRKLPTVVCNKTKRFEDWVS